MNCHLGWVPLLLVFLTPCIAWYITKPKIIYIYIQSDTPSQFKEAVVAAMHEWYGRAGYQIERVNRHTEANISFYINQLGPNLGRVFPEPYPQFPHIPRKEEGVKVVIDTECPKLYPTLLHEIGHTLGLRHRKYSIMQIESPRPTELTPLDLETIRGLHLGHSK